MKNIEPAKANAASAHFFQSALIFAAPRVGKSEIIQRDRFRLQQRLGLASDRASPIDKCAEHVEKQGLHRKPRTKLLTCTHSTGLSSSSGGDTRCHAPTRIMLAMTTTNY